MSDSLYWNRISEERRYGIWSEYVVMGGKHDYVSFCNQMESEDKFS